MRWAQLWGIALAPPPRPPISNRQRELPWSEGLAVGLISYPIVKWAAGKGREVHPALWESAVIFIAHYFWR
ncbi:hypothetical protein [uncultured Thermosynechococcus sp.]|uniref:hypothetical protein n=1 Tax=uncultured Thermosynechococcus sp. TaxID=436945 RepID=UPI002620720F|nr:hypothetical protein [uncultured Thermosynechococcus sp.]